MKNHRANSWRSRLGTMFPPLAQFAEEAPPPFGPETVLVVDDDESSTRACEAMLRTLGYEPLHACDLDEAMAAVAVHPVSIAIVDYHMAAAGGVDLSRELTRAAEARGRPLSLIMAAASPSKDMAIAALRASAADFLEKPIQDKNLRMALQRAEGLADAPYGRETLVSAMGRLADTLQRLSLLVDEPAARQRSIAPVGLEQPPEERHADLPGVARYIRILLKSEATRRRIGSGEVFGDPAWEMLLDLLLAKIESRQVSVSSACIASGAPMSTALRLVGRLVDEGVLQKLPDDTDRRRHFLVINPNFERPLLAYLAGQIERSSRVEEREAGAGFARK